MIDVQYPLLSSDFMKLSHLCMINFSGHCRSGLARWMTHLCISEQVSRRNRNEPTCTLLPYVIIFIHQYHWRR